MERQSRAYLYAAVAVLLWSTVATAFKIALRTQSPAQLLLTASLASATALLIILAAQGKLGLLRRATRRDWLRSAGMGLLNPFVYYLILFKAYSLLPGQEAQPLNFTWAIVMALLSVPLLGQRLRPASLLALLVGFAGVYVIATRGDLLAFRFTHPLGVSLALGSSVLWALYWILNLRDGRDEVLALLMGFLFGSAYILIFCLATGQVVAPSVPGLLGGIYVGLFEMGLTFAIWMGALRLSRTTAQVANLIYLAPFLSLVLLHWVVGEAIYPSSVAGLALIVAGIGIQKRLG